MRLGGRNESLRADDGFYFKVAVDYQGGRGKLFPGNRQRLVDLGVSPCEFCA
jgi:hypothetical protein